MHTKLRPIHSAEDVRERIGVLVDRLHRDYVGREVLFLVIAEGARRFAHELVRGLEARNAGPEVVTVRAHRTDGAALGEVQLESLDPAVFEGRDVLVIDDIVDEGRTLAAVLGLVDRGEPLSRRVAVLVNKHARRAVGIPIDYAGFEVKDGWVVGFGMDLDDRYRDLDCLAVVEDLD